MPNYPFQQQQPLDPQTWHTKVENGNKGSYQTLDFIRELILAGVNDYVVREEAMLACQNVKERDITSQINAIHRWVQRKFKYISDPYPVETLVSVRAIILNSKRMPGFGMDCDDFVILESALLRSLGIPTDLVIAACDRRRPKEFSHIYLRAYNKATKRWVSLDPTNKGKGAGWEPIAHLKKIIPLDLDSYSGETVDMPDVNVQYMTKHISRIGGMGGVYYR